MVLTYIRILAQYFRATLNIMKHFLLDQYTLWCERMEKFLIFPSSKIKNMIKNIKVFIFIKIYSKGINEKDTY